MRKAVQISLKSVVACWSQTYAMVVMYDRSRVKLLEKQVRAIGWPWSPNLGLADC